MKIRVWLLGRCKHCDKIVCDITDDNGELYCHNCKFFVASVYIQENNPFPKGLDDFVE